MLHNELKKLLASSFVFKANAKARHLLSDEGNVVVDPMNVDVANDSNFDKFLNTMLAFIDYVENHDTGSTVFDALNVDPSQYQVSKIICELASASLIWLSGSSSVLNKPVFQYSVPTDLRIMKPAAFNAYVQYFQLYCNQSLFNNPQAFSADKVVMEDLKSVMDGGFLLSLNPDGKVASQVTEILGISLPIENLSQYTTKLPASEKEDLILWLSQS